MNQLQTQTRKQWGVCYQHLLCQWISDTKLARPPEGTGHSFISWINLIHPKLWASFEQLWGVHFSYPSLLSSLGNPKVQCDCCQAKSLEPAVAEDKCCPQPAAACRGTHWTPLGSGSLSFCSWGCRHHVLLKKHQKPEAHKERNILQ